jgi:hypothetical protein
MVRPQQIPVHEYRQTGSYVAEHIARHSRYPLLVVVHTLNPHGRHNIVKILSPSHLVLALPFGTFQVAQV